MFPKNKTGKYFFHFPPSRNSTQKQYLQRDCVTFLEKYKLFIFFFSRKHFQKVLKPSVILFACFLPANIVWICHYVTAFPACTCELVRSTLSSFFARCRAKVCRSGSKDICTAQKGKQHGFPYFLLLLYLYFYSLSRIIIHVCFCVPSDLEVGYEKSILTRTETFSITICFKEPLLFITLFLKRMRFICYLFPFVS